MVHIQAGPLKCCMTVRALLSLSKTQENVILLHIREVLRVKCDDKCEVAGTMPHTFVLFPFAPLPSPPPSSPGKRVGQTLLECSKLQV